MRTRPKARERDREASEKREPVREPAPEIARILRLQAAAGNAAVVRLMRSPTDQERWEEDWNTPAYAGSQDKFKGDGRPAGDKRARYFALAPLYKAHGIDRPLQWAHENIHQATFFGSKTPAHDQLTAALAAAEKDLIAQGHRTSRSRVVGPSTRARPPRAAGATTLTARRSISTPRATRT